MNPKTCLELPCMHGIDHLRSTNSVDHLLAYGSINRASLSPLQIAIIPTPSHSSSEDSAEFTPFCPVVLVLLGIELSSGADIWNDQLADRSNDRSIDFYMSTNRPRTKQQAEAQRLIDRWGTSTTPTYDTTAGHARRVRACGCTWHARWPAGSTVPASGWA